MNLTLTITASPDVLAKILASLPDSAAVAVPNDPSTSTGTGIPGDRAFSPSLPSLAAPIQPAPFPPMQPTSTTSSDEDDDDGIAATGETDSNGLPWDERIHAGTKTQTQKGEWKKRKGVDAADVKRVEAELRARNAPPIPLPSGVPAPTPAPLPMMPVPQMGSGAVGMTPPLPMPTAAPVMPTPVPVAAPVMPVAQPEPTPQPVASAVPESVDVMTLMTKIATGQTAGTISAEYIADLTQRVAQAYQTPLNAITDMLARPEMLTYTAQLMAQDGKW